MCFDIWLFKCLVIIAPNNNEEGPFVNLGIGFEIATDIKNVIISSSIKPMYPKLSRAVT